MYHANPLTAVFAVSPDARNSDTAASFKLPSPAPRLMAGAVRIGRRLGLPLSVGRGPKSSGFRRVSSAEKSESHSRMIHGH